jgi:methyl-accepting chemotaxis protein
MDDQKKALESVGAAAAGVKRQVSETAADAKEKLTDFGRDAAGQVSDVAQSATDKAKAAADYLRQTEVSDMAEDVKDIVKRYPGWSMAVAVAVGFLLAHMGRNTNRFNY